MTFTYPAVFTPHKNDKGYHVTFPAVLRGRRTGPGGCCGACQGSSLQLALSGD